jgi:MoaA/NifB/PqqE/SkfB family radical SAM enzyme
MMCNRYFHAQQAAKSNGFMDIGLLQKLRPFLDRAEEIIVSGFGEPLLHPDFVKICQIVKSQGAMVYFYTNGILFTHNMVSKLIDIGVDRICISMGGATRSTYKRIRGVDEFATVCDNLRLIANLKAKKNSSKPLVTFNIVAMNSLLPELETLLHLAKELGVVAVAMPNLDILGEALVDESPWNNVETAEMCFAKARQLATTFKIDLVIPALTRSTNNCRDLFTGLNVTWDGLVLSCRTERYILGDLYHQPLEEIWNSSGLVGLRDSYFRDGLTTICADCTTWDNSTEAYHNNRNNSRFHAQILQ